MKNSTITQASHSKIILKINYWAAAIGAIATILIIAALSIDTISTLNIHIHDGNKTIKCGWSTMRVSGVSMTYHKFKLMMLTIGIKIGDDAEDRGKAWLAFGILSVFVAIFAVIGCLCDAWIEINTKILGLLFAVSDFFLLIGTVVIASYRPPKDFEFEIGATPIIAVVAIIVMAIPQFILFCCGEKNKEPDRNDDTV